MSNESLLEYFVGPWPDHEESKKQGKEVFKNIDCVKVSAGFGGNVVRPATDADKKHHVYDAFLEKKEFEEWKANRGAKPPAESGPVVESPKSRKPVVESKE